MSARTVREKVTASDFEAVPKPEKTWEELTPEEREALIKKLAEERGYVKK